MGSSPRVRGKRSRKNESGQRAHPRVCGENAYEARDGFQRPVSSPRGRGKLLDAVKASAGMHKGSSPRGRGKLGRNRAFSSTRAWAHPRVGGENASIIRPVLRGRAHPRVCGENKNGEDPSPACVRGSSPRVRGKRDVVIKSGVQERAHPRVGGENRAASSRLVAEGSSPRVRGKLPSLYQIDYCQGSSPRVRGKLLDHVSRSQTHWGSSPRVRGKRLPGGRSVGNDGAHPRVRGENYDRLRVR